MPSVEGLPARRAALQVLDSVLRQGRTLDAAKLKSAFAPLLEQGQGLLGKYGGEIAERARTIDVRNLPALLRQT